MICLELASQFWIFLEVVRQLWTGSGGCEAQQLPISGWEGERDYIWHKSPVLQYVSCNLYIHVKRSSETKDDAHYDSHIHIFCVIMATTLGVRLYFQNIKSSLPSPPAVVWWQLEYQVPCSDPSPMVWRNCANLKFALWYHELDSSPDNGPDQFIDVLQWSSGGSCLAVVKLKCLTGS